MHIGIVGARLAGSYAALLLAELGHAVVLFDDSVGREKPCGGGVTAKALRTMKWFRHHRLPHNEIHYLRMRTASGETATLPLRNPIHIFSRSSLDSALRDAAIRAGADFHEERALGFERDGDGWAVLTPTGTHNVDFLVGADGATSSVRPRVTTRFEGTDLSLALGYYVPGLFHPDTVVAAFQEHGFPGYLWSFPRVDHSSVGILRRLPGTRSDVLRQRVEDFIEMEYPGSSQGRRFYAARIPCLSRKSLATQKTAGKRWALLGDAAGFADAVTAEGIYYALRSAELLAGCFRIGDPAAFDTVWREDFGRDLLRSAGWRDRFYAGTLLFKAFVARAVQLTRLSETVGRLTDDVIAGLMDYAGLRRNLVLRSPQILVETVLRHLRLRVHALTS
jgi:flavin-dependent dehydrogenase